MNNLTTEDSQAVILHDLRPEAYEHPFDKQALNALEGTPGLETLIRKFHQYGLEKMMRVQYTGSNIKVNRSNLPKIYEIVETVCQRIHLPRIPEIYIQQGGINAFTTGSEKPIVVLNQGCVNELTFDELVFVIGHEVGHIKSQHVLYHQLASVLPIVSDLVGSVTFGIAGLVSKGLELALYSWQRKSEFTCDRAGLLACQNLDAAISAMMKIAGMPNTLFDDINPDDFLAQAEEFQEFDENKMDMLFKLYMATGTTHPWTVVRCAEMHKWVKMGAYDSLLEQHRGTPDELCTEDELAPEMACCPQCRRPIKKSSKFCMHCGTNMSTAEASVLSA